MQAELNLNHYSVKIDEDGIVAKAMEILASRIFKAGPVMDSPDTVKKYLMLKMAEHTKREVFGVLFLDSQNAALEYREMFFGTLNQTSVYPREVVRIALDLGAASVILTHNHPSGSVEQPCRHPSNEHTEIGPDAGGCTRVRPHHHRWCEQFVDGGKRAFVR